MKRRHTFYFSFKNINIDKYDKTERNEIFPFSEISCAILKYIGFPIEFFTDFAKKREFSRLSREVVRKH